DAAARSSSDRSRGSGRRPSSSTPRARNRATACAAASNGPCAAGADSDHAATSASEKPADSITSVRTEIVVTDRRYPLRLTWWRGMTPHLSEREETQNVADRSVTAVSHSNGTREPERWRVSGASTPRRLESWAEILADTHLAFDVDATPRTPLKFDGAVTRRRVGELMLVDCAASPFRGHRR